MNGLKGIFGIWKDIKYKTKADAWKPIRIDGSTHTMQTLEYEHHEIHSGSFYCVAVTVDDLGQQTTPDNVLSITFTAPTGTAKRLHMIFTAQTGGEALFTVRETAGPIVGGAAITPVNHRRDSSNVSIVTDMVQDANDLAGGIFIHQEYLGQGSSNPGTTARGNLEFILNPGDVYQVRLFDATNVTAALILRWYEHTDKETIT